VVEIETHPDGIRFTIDQDDCEKPEVSFVLSSDRVAKFARALVELEEEAEQLRPEWFRRVAQAEAKYAESEPACPACGRRSPLSPNHPLSRAREWPSKARTFF